MTHQPLSFDRMDWADVQASITEPEATPAPPIDTGLQLEPGLYFGLSDDAYHALPALSASGIKNLLVSPMLYWAESFLNPERQDEETDALELGKAYHCRIAEGKGAFQARYAVSFDKTAHPDALDTSDEIKVALKDLGLPVSGKKADLISRLLDADPSAQVLDTLKAEYERENAGKRLISASVMRQVEIAARMIELDEVASKCFTGGYPEVSVVWHDPETGVPMKARFDYLKIGAIVDLKSFSNPLAKPIDKAIYAAMASRKYHVQAATYVEADKWAMKFAQEGKVHTPDDFTPVHAETLLTWVKNYAAFTEQRRFVFVFQQTGKAPLTRVKEMPRNLVFDCGTAAMREAQRRFSEFWNRYGRDQWLDLAPMTTLVDDEFPLYTTEI